MIKNSGRVLEGVRELQRHNDDSFKSDPELYVHGLRRHALEGKSIQG